MDGQGYAGAESFADAARAYCDHVSRMETVDYAALSGLMFEVGRAELGLEWMTEEYDDKPLQNVGITADHELALEGRLRNLLAPDVGLHEVQSNIDDADKERVGVLSIDLAELYGELMNGLIVWDRNQPDARMHAAWLWKHQAEHWTEHLCRGLMSIQELRFKFGRS
jgi:hypothetical protein